ncbi:transferrin-like isoform X2 [Zootermopsis nevadensis]|uniref:transferrin-like isoform X2 n=1 Tax=Zootermopsis nevadensis TaxID=136037 RepID=UPI000B8E46EE|nr:transferrin-like isoform X2 [Zootermopsis nevadensis]
MHIVRDSSDLHSIVILLFLLHRVCVTEKSNRKYNKYCPLLEMYGSKSTCVLGNSRIDCLRKVLQGRADFGLFLAEDIIVASSYKNPHVLVTDEIRMLDTPFEYEVYAVVRKSSNITRKSQLQGKKFCHSGYGYEPQWSKITSEYFEAQVVTPVCDADLTAVENSLKSSSQFFKAACKAGPWVPDLKLDTKLKQTYSNLCKLCGNPSECSVFDKYWGAVGTLYCLTDGAGDVAWARLPDIENHFGINGEEPAQAPAEEYSFLCQDDRLAPLDNPENCAWLSRPWAAVIARREVAEGVREILPFLKNAKYLSWQWALEELLEIHTQTIEPLDSMMVPEDYLQNAHGFLSANNLAHCEPSGKVRICTKSSAEMNKCDLLKRVAKIYGIEPQLECLEGLNAELCMKAVQSDTADVITTQPDDLFVGYREFGLKPLLYEYTKNLTSIHKVAAVVHTNSPIKHIDDLKGKRACFSVYNGVGWNSILSVLRNKTLVSSTCSGSTALGEFFSESCAPGVNKSRSFPSNLQALCEKDFYSGEAGAFRCLAAGKGEVAFIKLSTIKEYTDGANNEPWTVGLKSNSFRALCLDDQTGECYLSWATPGQVLIRANTTDLKKKEISVALMGLGNLFGKYHKGRMEEFQMFAPFDNENNVLFQDVTYHFEEYSLLQEGKEMDHNYERMVELPQCSSAHTLGFSSMSLLAFLLLRLISV